MVRGAVGGRCDHTAGDRNADPMVTEDGVEKLPIDRRVEAAARNANRKDSRRKPKRQTAGDDPLGKPVHHHTERDQRKHIGREADRVGFAPHHVLSRSGSPTGVV